MMERFSCDIFMNILCKYINVRMKIIWDCKSDEMYKNDKEIPTFLYQI